MVAGVVAWNTTDGWAAYWVTLIVGMATALSVAGLFDVLFNTEQREAFEKEVAKQLEATVIGTTFVEKLNDNACEQLRRKIVSKLTRRREEELAPDDSFYGWFAKEFISILSGPYRVNLQDNIDIRDIPGDTEYFSMCEVLSYNCRVSAESHVQDTIEYALADVVTKSKSAELQSCSVVVREAKTPESREFLRKDYTVDHGGMNTEKIDPINLTSTEAYKRDNLYIEITVHGKMKKNKIQTWQLTRYPADTGATFLITAPAGCTFECSVFAGTVKPTIHDNTCQIVTGGSWLFPGDGFVYRVIDSRST
jgi:hypothetical protein